MNNLLEVNNLNVDFLNDGGYVRVISNLSFSLAHNEALGIVGESGSGKSVTSLAVMRLLPAAGARVQGEILFGGIAGYAGGFVDDVMMRFSEMVQSFPPLILAMVIAAALGPNITNSIFAMAIIWWPNYARLTRSIVISVKENDYITASRILGASHLRILYKEILPNSIGPMAVMCTLDLGNAILMFSGLSFLGLGVQPPLAEWGAMVSDGVLTFNYWWISTFPGLAIFSVAIGANFIGDGLRDYLDPRMRRRI